MPYDKPQELLEHVTQLSRDHAPLRALGAKLEVVGLNYAYGNHWTQLQHNPHTGGSSVDVWNEDWDHRSMEMRVTDNRIGPIVRRIAASTNASRVEATVRSPDYMRDIRYTRIASSSELALNGIHDMAGYTRAYRNASSFRWKAGSSLMILRVMRGKNLINMGMSTMPNGEPVEVDDVWIKWEYAPLSAMIWEVGNISSSLEDHGILILDEPMTLRKFRSIYGPIEDYGISESELPTLGVMAKHYTTAAEITGSSLYSAYKQHSGEKALRLISVFRADENDPTYYRYAWRIVDVTAGGGPHTQIRGNILNWDNPETEIGGNGLPIIKLDAYKRCDSVHSAGIPHILSAHNDMINLSRSIQFQQMSNVIHGMWLADLQTTKREDFATQLNEVRPGGVLTYDSGGDNKLAPPHWIKPNPPDQTFSLITSELSQVMRDSAHISPLNLGQSKTHVPHSTNMALLQEAAVVIDSIIAEDVDSLSCLLKNTLGTIRGVAENGWSMLARLRDEHGFEPSDLIALMELDPRRIPFKVRAIEASILSRGTDERIIELDKSLQFGQITPTEHLIAMADELGRPILRTHRLELEMCKSAVRNIISGGEWPGMASIDFETFARVAQEAIYGLDMDTPESLEAIARLEEAIQVQKQVADENPVLQRPMVAAGGQSQEAGGVPQDNVPQGAPGSIDPLSAPIGAAGGLPMGLTSSF